MSALRQGLLVALVSFALVGANDASLSARLFEMAAAKESRASSQMRSALGLPPAPATPTKPVAAPKPATPKKAAAAPKAAAPKAATAKKAATKSVAKKVAAKKAAAKGATKGAAKSAAKAASAPLPPGRAAFTALTGEAKKTVVVKPAAAAVKSAAAPVSGKAVKTVAVKSTTAIVFEGIGSGVSAVTGSIGAGGKALLAGASSGTAAVVEGVAAGSSALAGGAATVAKSVGTGVGTGTVLVVKHIGAGSSAVAGGAVAIAKTVGTGATTGAAIAAEAVLAGGMAIANGATATGKAVAAGAGMAAAAVANGATVAATAVAEGALVVAKGIGAGGKAAWAGTVFAAKSAGKLLWVGAIKAWPTLKLAGTVAASTAGAVVAEWVVTRVVVFLLNKREQETADFDDATPSTKLRVSDEASSSCLLAEPMRFGSCSESRWRMAGRWLRWESSEGVTDLVVKSGTSPAAICLDAACFQCAGRNLDTGDFAPKLCLSPFKMNLEIERGTPTSGIVAAAQGLMLPLALLAAVCAAVVYLRTPSAAAQKKKKKEVAGKPLATAWSPLNVEPTPSTREVQPAETGPTAAQAAGVFGASPLTPPRQTPVEVASGERDNSPQMKWLSSEEKKLSAAPAVMTYRCSAKAGTGKKLEGKLRVGAKATHFEADGQAAGAIPPSFEIGDIERLQVYTKNDQAKLRVMLKEDSPWVVDMTDPDTPARGQQLIAEFTELLHKRLAALNPEMGTPEAKTRIMRIREQSMKNLQQLLEV